MRKTAGDTRLRTEGRQQAVRSKEKQNVKQTLNNYDS